MIIVNIKGGLGNQLFQYALSRKIELLHGCEIKFDINSYNNYIFPHKFRLHKFNIKDKIAKQSEIEQILNNYKDPKRIIKKGIFNRYGVVSKILRIAFWQYDYLTYYKRKIVIEKPTIFDKRILNIKDDVYLDGYWAKYKYFDDIRSILLNDLELKEEFKTNEYKRIKKDIQSKKNAVSIHIRRGYLKREIDKKIFGVLPIEYYKKAIQFITEYVKSPFFFIFSDDIEWVKSNFDINGDYNLINLGSDGDYLELKLMSFCKHNIIANSTFSWWGAWLNPNTNKIVIAPKRWYNDSKYQKNYEKNNYFIIKEWIKL